MVGPGNPISGYGAQQGLMTEVNAAGEDRDHREHQSDLDAQELLELEQAEYYGGAPTAPHAPARQRSLLDRLLRRG